MEWNLKAIYSSCTLISEPNEETMRYGTLHSLDLVNEGYIKKKELHDVDNKSYCDAFIEIHQTPYDSKGYDNCEISYKIFLKCKDYEEEDYLKE